MAERLSVREILNQTNEVFFRHFGKLVAPALVYAAWRHAHGNVLELRCGFC
jgi:hypothetical protein